MGERVLMLCVDGLAWSQVRAGIDAGELPHFSALLKDGAFAEVGVSSAIPGLAGVIERLNSPTLWTTIATGQHYFQHGVYDFRNLIDPAAEPPLFESRHVRSPRIWDVLGSFGFHSLVVGYYVTHPASLKHGVMVSDLFGEIKGAGTTAPAEMAERLQALQPPLESDECILARFTQLPPDAVASLLKRETGDRSSPLLSYRLFEPARRDARMHAAMSRLIDEQRWDFSALYLRLIDFVSHGFWTCGNRLPTDFVSKYGAVVGAAYRWIDGVIGEYRARLNPGDRMIVLSDHGFSGRGLRATVDSASEIWDISYGEHSEPAFLATLGGPTRGEVRDVTLLDIAPSIYDFFGIPSAESLDGAGIPELLGRSEYAPEAPQNADPLTEYSFERTQAASEITEAEQRSIVQRLAALGYMDE